MSSETQAKPVSALMVEKEGRPGRGGWFAAGLTGAVLVHVAAIATIVLPALPATRSWTTLRDMLPQIRTLGTALGTLVVVALVIFAMTGRLALRTALIRGAVLGVLLGTGHLYGHTATTHVERKPVVTATTPNGQRAFDHQAFDAVLARFVDEHGMVDYRGLVAARASLDEYVGQLATASPRSNPELFPTADDRTAYWINAYNALMMRAVVDHYPIGSVTDIMAAHGVFSRLYFPVGGRSMTLDDIEKGILLTELDDPRVHFALTCASMSCPRIDRAAFHAADLDQRLDAEGRDFLASSDGLQIDRASGQVRLSRYFEWYADDFGDDPLSFVARYLTADRRAALAELRGARVSYLPYDWRLNDQAASWAAR